MLRDRLIASGAEALLKARHPDLRTVPPMEKLMAAQVALVVVDAITPELMAHLTALLNADAINHELRRRLGEAEELLRACQDAFHREGWEPGPNATEVGARVDDYIADIDTEAAIEKAAGRQ